ncbi:MAG: UDP-N-acetylmuramate--L-alanine ligase [Alphaproteobacteria bacterium]|jgi:UDP-N-acetylmuramate--alanine ligase|nr:UDP-N-acetylmuramate--L-alanine ligase [Alphaproteobacteria bacterium]MBU2042967.1 UDP-N-acetylmuramate--L-alanine ligase [Alphaproteobacteria bacterium]MBU2165466.1 UDP-N-acetylmuramate--L-alanine ligase [Alphaproteobacteria bacterium]MBU2207221.1 UDP-N-acetylmuramate--L-alanine ligase [Alphaproteobacteria bacterium]MBU2396034.1 UDP-N-acetylmuramate--L-alanine ligase [Alphaproteobacteria bacterium]
MIARLRPVPFDLGPVHFVGIGGIGMSGIAEIMLKIGYSVQGSDAKASANTERLEKLGARVFIGHDAAHIGDGVSAVVYSTAVKATNPEMVVARERRIPLVRRAEMLAELMRLQFSIAVGGTHGKTTTTSMVAAILDAGGLDPTVVNGGIINAYGTNAKVGDGDWIVVEADESDGSFLRLKSTVAIVTNIDPEHLDHYGDFDGVRKAFVDFVENIPFYGFAAVCLDHPEVQRLVASIDNRRLVTYGVNPQAMVRADNVEMKPDGCRFDVVVQGQGLAALDEPIRITGLHLPMAGWHNVANALAAIAVARELDVSDEAIRAGLAGFGGVRRRFTTTGIVGGVRIVDDYGHHPVEIAAVLKAARQVAEGRVIAVVQPHRFTRLESLMEEFSTCFSDADAVFVADVYAAGETPIEGVDKDALVEGIRRFGHRSVQALESVEALPGVIAAEAKAGDLVVLLGAGDITQWAYALPGQLEGLG